MHMEIRKADGGPRRGGTGNEGLYGGARRETQCGTIRLPQLIMRLKIRYWSKRHEVKHHKSRKYTGIKKSTDIASIVDCIPLNRRENKSVS